ncbi:hypothetical protein HHL21_18185 [Massilia sp. RP-1-19]|uniref:YaiO family outer membrane beta-barrel protein n=1 Tax=Massilia polaris TaxID=2728846 RepID=A0A848HNV7_9BURK|nr:TorF family putative porin [Massilia polaris]NML62972.1 hypothetical protein [Massilia polaris]
MSLNCSSESKQSLSRALRIVAAAACLLAASGARGQLSGSVSLASEYSARGVSLSNGRAAPQFSLSYDGAQGWFAGASAAPRLTLAGRSGVTKTVAYGGYARRLRSGLSWEAGASSTWFSHVSAYNYRELFLGLASDRLSGRLYLAPAYYGYGGRAAYLELTGFHPLGERIKLVAQAGILHGLKGHAASARDRVDMRLAISFDSGPFNVQLAVLRSAGIGSGTDRAADRAARSLAASTSYSF